MRMMNLVRGLRDSKGKPVMFGITGDGTLAVLGAAFGETSGGETSGVKVDLPAPVLPYAHAVAASQNKQGQIWLAASFGKDADSPSALYVCGPLSNDPTTWLQNSGQEGGRARFQWTLKRAQGAETQIPEIQIGTDDDGQGPPMILIATTLNSGRVPRFERLSAAPNDNTVEQFPKFEDAGELLDVAIGALPQARGAYALYRIGNRQQLEFVGVPDSETNVSMQVSLTPPDGALKLETQLTDTGYTDLIVRGNGVFRFTWDAQETSWASGEKIADDTVPPLRVTSRSVLTDDHGKDSQGVFGSRKAFRSTITFPPETCQVQIWATEATTAEIDGQPVQLNPTKALRLSPSAVSRITVSLPPVGLTCPTLIIRTNEMSYHERLYIFPDMELHRSIAQLPDDALFNARDQLGVSNMSQQSAAGVQKVVQNLTRSVQYTHNRTAYGFHNDRSVYANNLEDSHFSLTTGAGGYSYQALDRQQAAGASNGATTVSVDDLNQARGELQTVTITTLDKIGGSIIEAVRRTEDDLSHMFSSMGDDLVRGDFFGTLGDLFQGGENVATDLYQGATNVFNKGVEGGANILVAVVTLAGKTLLFTLEHSGKVGEFLTWLLKQVGIALKSLFQWLAKAIGWDDILKTHDVLRDLINGGLDSAVKRIDDIKARGDAVLQTAEENMNTALDSAIKQFGGVPEQKQTFSNELSEATEWLVHRLSTHSESASKIPYLSNVDSFTGTFDEIITKLEERLGSTGDKVIAAVQAAGIDLQKFIENKDRPELLIAALLEIAKALGTICLEVARLIWDLLMSMLEGIIKAFKDILNEVWDVPFLSDFYSFLTNGRKLSLLSITSLIVAIPTTLIYKGIFNTPPFQESVEFSMSLTGQPDRIVAAGAVSAATQFAMIFTNVASAGIQLLDFDFSDNPTPPADRPSSIKPSTTALTYIDLALTILAHGVALPWGYPDLSNDLFWQDDITMKAPSVNGWFLWDSNWFILALVLIANVTITGMQGAGIRKGKVSRSQDAVNAGRSVLSVWNIVCASVQQDSEYKKQQRLESIPDSNWSNTYTEDALRERLLSLDSPDLNSDELAYRRYQLYTSTLPQLQSQVASLQNYLTWAKDLGISTKGFAIFMGILPNTARFLYMPALDKATEGIAFLAGAAVNVFFRLSGGITQSVRTGKNALL